jgi:hypothetical protein
LRSIASGNNSPLAAGGSYTQSAQVTLPSGVAAGTYYIFVSTNDIGQQPETNDANNTMVSTGVAVTGADLTVSSVTSPAGADFGQTVTVDWSVLNTGASPATQSWTDGIYISADSTFSSYTATLLEDVPVGANSPLAANASYNQSASVTLPAVTAQSTNDSTYYLYVVANDQQQQPVTDQTNNVSAAQTIVLTLPPLPDLVEQNVSAPAAAFNNTQVLVSWTDVNQGTAAAVGPWTDSVYYSTSSDGSNPTLLGQFTYPNCIRIRWPSVLRRSRSRRR